MEGVLKGPNDDFWYPICPPRLKDIGVITKNPQMGLFTRVFGNFARFGGHIWVLFWHKNIKKIKNYLPFKISKMPT